MLDNPICQRPLKANVPARLFRLNPLVLQDFFPLSLEFPIKRRVLQQLIRRKVLFRFVRHNRGHNLFCSINSKDPLGIDNLKVQYLTNRFSAVSPAGRCIFSQMIVRQEFLSQKPPPESLCHRLLGFQ
jgi:hypothetical protein